MPGRTSAAGAAASVAGKQLAPRLSQLAPGLTTSFVREALHRAITGVGPLPPAARAADKQLAEQHGDVERAVHEVIENHVRYAGAQGLVTNLGGIATMAVAVPANITGLALIPTGHNVIDYVNRINTVHVDHPVQIKLGLSSPTSPDAARTPVLALSKTFSAP